MDQLAAWLPLLIIFALLFWWARRTQNTYKTHVDEVNAVNRKIVDTNQAMIAELREIKEILKARD